MMQNYYLSILILYLHEEFSKINPDSTQIMNSKITVGDISLSLWMRSKVHKNAMR